MYKKIILVAALVAFGFTANAQLFDFSSNKDDFNVGLTIGEVGFGAGNSPATHGNKPYAGFGWGGSLSFYGVYVDCLINSPEYQYDNHVRDYFQPDQRAFTVNFGYKIPIFSWLRIAPIIGYSQTSYGYIDYSSVNIEVDSESSTGRIYHDYIIEEDEDEFNYGGGIFIAPLPYFEISFIGTKRAIYGGINLNLSTLYE